MGQVAWSYARQSKDHDAGIARQQADTDGLAARRGFVIPDDGRFTDNDISASKSRRNTDYAKMMALISAGNGPDVLLITYMDRLYRQPIELEQIIPVIEKAGVLVATVYEGDMDLRTDTGQLQARVKVAFARAEVMRKANRQKRANRERAEQGGRTPHGIRPFGYCDDRVSPREDEADAIRWACTHVLAGGSVSAISREWTRRGVKPRFDGRTYRNGKGEEVPYTGRWSHPSVLRILTNPHIAGLVVYQGEVIGTGSWAPLVTPETFYAVRDMLRDPGRAKPRGKVSLGGFLFYCRCGAKVQRDMRHRKGNGSYAIYKCTEYGARREGGRPGPHVTVKADPVDAYVEMRLLDQLRDPVFAEVFTRSGEGGADVPKLRAEQKEVSEGLARMAGDAAMGILPRGIYLDAAKRVTARLEEIEAQIAEAGKADAVTLLLAADDPADVWAGLDVTVQRKVVESLVHVMLRPPGAGCRNPDMNYLVRIAWKD